MIIEQSIRLEVGEANAPTRMTWDEAITYCSNLGDGWRLPTKDELALMYEHKAELGGFGEGWLWSSSQNNYGSYAWVQLFSDGDQDGISVEDGKYGVRAVRAIARAGGGMAPLRSDDLVARVRDLCERSEDKALANAAWELANYHLEMRDACLRLESELHKTIKEIENDIN